MFNKYSECGFSVIPTYKTGKNPTFVEWQKHCIERPTQDKIDKWQAQFEKGLVNIGIACGPASSVVALDIDTDDKEILDLCPRSPCVKFGRRGDTRFFKYTPDIISQDFPVLQILSIGRQTVIPPSIHCDTGKPYIWLSPDTLLDGVELPILDLGFLKNLKMHPKFVVEKTGRNNKLVDIITAMRGRGEPESLIVDEVYRWDLNHNQPRLFTDPTESYKAKTESEAMQAAWKMVNSVTASMLKFTKNCAFLLGDALAIHLTDAQEQALAKKFNPKKYPEPTGLIKDIRDLILDFSERDMPNLALGGAIALMGAVCSNRFRFDRAWTNVYILNLAPTGAGKSAPQDIIKMILDEKLQSPLSGFGNYHSTSAFVKNLVSRRERLDVIDEVGSLFAQLKGGGLYQTGLVDEMCKVWSASSTKYTSTEYAADDKDTSTSWNPCVSLLGSSTHEAMRASITKLMTMKGLMPRFLIFSHEDYGKPKLSGLNEALLERIAGALGDILAEPKATDALVMDVLHGPKFTPKNVAPTNGQAKLIFDTMRLEFFERIESELSQPIKDMLTRGKEQIMKLATIHAAGNARVIDVTDLTWAKEVWEVCLHNCSALIQETAVDGDWEKDIQKIISLAKKNGGILTEAKIANRLEGIPPQRRRGLLEHLVTAEKLTRVITGVKKVPGWQLV